MGKIKTGVQPMLPKPQPYAVDKTVRKRNKRRRRRRNRRKRLRDELPELQATLARLAFLHL